MLCGYISPDQSLAAFEAAVGLIIALACVLGSYFLLTLPLRRAERARLFLDLLENTLNDGRPLEETIMAISRTRDHSVGLRFHALAAWLEEGLTLSAALEKVPRLLPPSITATLEAGKELGDLRKVMPACRQLLADAFSRSQSAIPYLFMITIATAPLGTFIYVRVIPKFRGLFWGLGLDLKTSPKALAIFDRWPALLTAQWAIAFLLVAALLLYAGGAGATRWFPGWDRIQLLKPWSRKRLQRDFSTMLGISLDSGLPEPAGVRLAADATGNKIFRARAERVIARLASGVPLPEAVTLMDNAGEFRWRLCNAFQGRAHFLRALAGWNASLEAKAYQQEQAAGQLITTALVLWNGVFVGSLVLAVFMFLISIIDAGLLW